MEPQPIHATTVCCVRRDGAVAMAGDGQVTLGNAVVKSGAQKVRASANGQALIGFAGGAADAMALTERLEAMLLVGDPQTLLLVSGGGDVIEPDDGVVAVGSGSGYALAAARALLAHTAMPAAEVAEHALRIAAEICIYTNDHITVKVLP